MASCDRGSGIEHRFGESINRTLQGRYKAVRNVLIEGIVRSRQKQALLVKLMKHPRDHSAGGVRRWYKQIFERPSRESVSRK
jgi:hypothetical protein